MTPPPPTITIHQEENREIAPIKEERRNIEPVREPPRKIGSMDGPNHRDCHKNNIIGDPNAGRSIRDRTKGRSLFTMGDQGKDLDTLGNYFAGIFNIFQGMFLNSIQKSGWHIQPPRPPDAENDKEDNMCPLETELAPTLEPPEDCSSRNEIQ